jgi:hypothetical protein
MPIFKEGDVVTIDNILYKVCREFNPVNSCGNCAFYDSKNFYTCGNKIRKALKMSVSCKEFIGSMMVFKKINDLKGGV